MFSGRVHINTLRILSDRIVILVLNIRVTLYFSFRYAERKVFTGRNNQIVRVVGNASAVNAFTDTLVICTCTAFIILFSGLASTGDLHPTFLYVSEGVFRRAEPDLS